MMRLPPHLCGPADQLALDREAARETRRDGVLTVIIRTLGIVGGCGVVVLAGEAALTLWGSWG